MMFARLKQLVNRKLPWDKAIISDVALWLALVLLLAYGAYWFAVLLPERHGQTIVLSFRNVNEISKGSSVRMMGLDVGYVSDVQRNGDHVRVKVQIYPHAPEVPSGSRFTILFTGLAGAKSIEIELPTQPYPTANGDPVYFTEEPIRMRDMLNASINVTQALQKGAENITDFFGKKKPVEELQRNIRDVYAGSRTARKDMLVLNRALLELRRDISENASDAVNAIDNLTRETNGPVRISLAGKMRPKILGFFQTVRHFGSLFRGQGESLSKTAALNRYIAFLEQLNMQQMGGLRYLCSGRFQSSLQGGLLRFETGQRHFDHALDRFEQFVVRFSPAGLEQARHTIQSFNRKLQVWNAGLSRRKGN